MRHCVLQRCLSWIQKRWKTFPLAQQILPFLVGQPGQGRTLTKARELVKVYSSLFYICLAKGKTRSSTLSPKKQQLFPQLTPTLRGLTCTVQQTSAIVCSHILVPWLPALHGCCFGLKKTLRGNQLFLFEFKSPYCSGNVSPKGCPLQAA